ncbi:MAG: hypothetical protein IT198_14640 [Acidimicrobiia bacterium]|nr:hypothetical protein [Acidimicrobiia bacterium]
MPAPRQSPSQLDASQIDSFRIHAPRTPPTLPRPLLVKQVQDRDVVLLVAGSGYGKTVLAKLIAEGGEGPIAWYGAAESDDAVSTTRLVTLALARAWPDVGTDLPARSGPDGLAPHLAYVLAEIAGPGTIVIDDAHRLPDAVARPLLTTMVAALPDGVKLVIASHHDPPLETPALIACGRALQLGAHDLAFSPDEVLEILGPETSPGLGSCTWPIAVGLARELGSAPLLESQQERLVAGILDTLDPVTRDLATVVGHVPGIDADTIRRVGPATSAARLEVFAAKHPSLLRLEDRHWTASDLLTSYVRTVHVGDGLVKRVVAALEGDAVTQAYFLTTSRRPALARQVLSEVAPDLIDSDRSHTAIRVLGLLDDADDSAPVQLLRALALSTPTRGTIEVLDAAWRRLGREGDPLALVAAGILAGALLMLGDARAAAVAVEALTTASGASLEEAALRRALGNAGPDAPHLANLVSTLAILLVFTGRKADRFQARRLLELAREHMRGTLDAAFARGVEAAVELGTGGISPQAAVAHLERSVTQHRCAATHAYGLLLLQLAGAHLEQGDVDSAQRTGRELEDWICEWGVTGLRPLSDAHQALCALERGAAPASAEAAWSGLQEHAPERACDLATRVGNILLDRDDQDGAALWVARAEANLPHSTFADWERQVLRARFDADMEALARLADIYRRAGADHFATRVERLVSGRETPAPRQRPHPPRVELLGPRIVVVHGEDRAYLRGFGAHLLALLVSRGGVVHSEVAIDTLWRDADPESARNRLYIVVHRLRRMLGVDDIVLHCADGLVNFDPGDTMSVDVCDFRDAREAGDHVRAAFAYRGPFCSDQFLYDDAATSFRRELHAEFVGAARHALEDSLASGNTGLAVRLAAHIATLTAPDDEVTLLAAGVLATDGQRGRARDLLDREAHLVAELGLEREPPPDPRLEGTA